jgi:hypothetical protein
MPLGSVKVIAARLRAVRAVASQAKGRTPRNRRSVLGIASGAFEHTGSCTVRCPI